MLGHAVPSSVNTPTTAPRVPSLRENFSWTVLGNLFYAACQWGVVTVIAKTGSPEMVGQFALALAITTPVVQFLNLQLRSIQATDARREFEFLDYLSLRSATTFLGLLALVAFAFFGSYDGETAWIIVLVSLAKAIDAVIDVFSGLFQQQEQMHFISLAMIVNGLLSFSLLTVGLWSSGSLVQGVVGYAAGSLLTLLWVVLPSAQTVLLYTYSRPERWRLRLRSAEIGRLSLTALPLGISMLLISLNTNVPRYVLERFTGENGLGIFAALSYLIVIGTTVVSAMGQAVSPRLSKYFAAGNTVQFSRILSLLIIFGLAMGVVGAVISKFSGELILRMLYTKEYAEYSDVLVMLSVAAGVTFAASFAGYGMTAARSFRVQVPVFLVVVIVATCASIYLIPRHEMMGAAVVLLVTAASQLVLSSLVVVHELRKRMRVGE